MQTRDPLLNLKTISSYKTLCRQTADSSIVENESRTQVELPSKNILKAALLD